VELVGWVGAEPEQQFVSLHVAACNLRVATQWPAGRNEVRERLVEAEWATIQAWEQLAEEAGAASSLAGGTPEISPKHFELAVHAIDMAVLR
jgi:single-stranded DNA-binding protein